MNFFYVNFDVGESNYSKEYIREFANKFARQCHWPDTWYWSHTIEPTVAPGREAFDRLTNVVKVLFRTPGVIPVHKPVMRAAGPFGFAAECARPEECSFNHGIVSRPAVISSSRPTVGLVVLNDPVCSLGQLWPNHSVLSQPERYRFFDYGEGDDEDVVATGQTVELKNALAARLWRSALPNALDEASEVQKRLKMLPHVSMGPPRLLRLELRIQTLPSDEDKQVFTFTEVEPDDYEEEETTDVIYNVGVPNEDVSVTDKFCRDGIKAVFGGRIPALFVLVVIDVISYETPSQLVQGAG